MPLQSKSHIVGLLLLATVNGVSQIVFHYPPSEPESSHSEDPNEESKDTESVSNQSMGLLNDEFDEDIFLSDDTSSNNSVLGNESDSSEEISPSEQHFTEAEKEYNINLDRDYDKNNTLTNVEQFANDLFIEAVLNDEYNLEKLRYKVSSECSNKLQDAASKQKARTGKMSHHRFYKDKGKRKKKEAMQQSKPLKPVKSPLSLKGLASPVSSKADKPTSHLKEYLDGKVDDLKQRLQDVFTFESEKLCDMLTFGSMGATGWYSEVKLDNFCFLGVPRTTQIVAPAKQLKHIRASGRSGRNTMSGRDSELEYLSSGLPSETPVSDYTSRYHSSGAVNSSGPVTSSSARTGTPDKAIHSSVTEYSVVIVTNSRPHEYLQRRDELKENILGKITTILENQQQKYQYVEKEILAILDTHKKFMDQLYAHGKSVRVRSGSTTSDADSGTSIDDSDTESESHGGITAVDQVFTLKNYYEAILDVSSLARALFECYNNLLNSQIFKLSINNITYSFNIPLKKNFSFLPHRSVKLKGSEMIEASNSEDYFRQLSVKNQQQSMFGHQIRDQQRFKQNVHYIGSLLDESFYRNNIFPSVNNLSKIKKYYYLNNFESATTIYDAGKDDEITKIFKSCSYEKYSLLMIDELDDIVEDLDPNIAKDFKAFIEKINATKPLKKIIKELFQEIDAKEPHSYKANKGAKLKNKVMDSKKTKKPTEKKKASLIAHHKDEAQRENVVISMIYHLIYWEKVKFVLPITKNTKFVISPLANIGTINEEVKSIKQIEQESKQKFNPQEFSQLDSVSYSKWIKGINREFYDDFRLMFPSLPPLSEFLSYFNSSKSYFSLNNENAVAILHLDACCWLMKSGLIVQYFTFGWFVLTSSIKMQVFEDQKIIRASSDSDSIHPPELISFSRGTRKSQISRDSGFMKHSGDYSMSSNGYEENSVILKPSSPQKFEAKCIEKILKNKSKATELILYKILKYLDGKTPFEVILLKENIKRTDFNAALKELGEHIIVYHHW